MNSQELVELVMIRGPSLVQEINSIMELRIHIPCISMQNQVFNLVVRQITTNDFYDGFVKEFLNMIEKNSRNSDVRMI